MESRPESIVGLEEWDDWLSGGGRFYAAAGNAGMDAQPWTNDTASFLIKDLLINWQQGEEWFMRQLVDGDLAANNGGWQWTAGVGTDAAPYFKIFNFVKHLFLLSGKIGSQVIARQDKRVVTRQEPKKTA